AGSTHTLILKYDFQGANAGTAANHFVDHLTTVDRSIALTTVQICNGVSGCSGAPSATASIPVDATNPAGAQISGQQLRAWNIQSISFTTGYSLATGVKQIPVNFTVAAASGDMD